MSWDSNNRKWNYLIDTLSINIYLVTATTTSWQQLNFYGSLDRAIHKSHTFDNYFWKIFLAVNDLMLRMYSIGGNFINNLFTLLFSWKKELFGWPTANFGPFQGGSLTNPLLFTAFYQFRPEGHQQPCNKVGSLSPATKCLVGFETGTFQFYDKALTH